MNLATVGSSRRFSGLYVIIYGFALATIYVPFISIRGKGILSTYRSLSFFITTANASGALKEALASVLLSASVYPIICFIEALAACLANKMPSARFHLILGIATLALWFAFSRTMFFPAVVVFSLFFVAVAISAFATIRPHGDEDDQSNAFMKSARLVLLGIASLLLIFVSNKGGFGMIFNAFPLEFY